jgi:hypothetical protein
MTSPKTPGSALAGAYRRTTRFCLVAIAMSRFLAMPVTIAMVRTRAPESRKSP